MGLINLIFNLKMQQIRLHPKSSKMRYKNVYGFKENESFFGHYKVRYKMSVGLSKDNELFCILVRVDKAC
jgi:hypothetical protein